MLLDFPDSKVSRPLYGGEERPESPPTQKELVRLEREHPRSEIPDEALRTEIRDDENQCQTPQPHWQAVIDEDELMSQDDREWRIKE